MMDLGDEDVDLKRTARQITPDLGTIAHPELHLMPARKMVVTVAD